MKTEELKEDFYKRYGSGDGFLHFTSYGILCPLLGYIGTEDAPFISCALSMGVRMFARVMGGCMIKLQSSVSNKCLSYTFGTPAELFGGKGKAHVKIIKQLEQYGLNGAEILYDSTVPNFLSDSDAFSAALVSSLIKTSNIEVSPLKAAQLISQTCDESALLAVLSAKHGYATASGTNEQLPLPLFGCKIISAHCTKQDKKRGKLINSAMDDLKKIYPHVSSISQLTEELVRDAGKRIKSKTARGFLLHLATENERIKTASAALKGCNVRVLFNEMNSSLISAQRLWNVESEHLFLAESAAKLDGVKAVRFWENGIFVIAENDMTDYIIGALKRDFEDVIGYQPTFCVSNAV